MLAALAEAGEAGFAKGGRRGMLAAIVARQEPFHALGQVPAYSAAGTYGLLGDSVSAMQWLQRSFARNEAATIGIGIDPAFAGMRNDSAFRALVIRAGVKQAAD